MADPLTHPQNDVSTPPVGNPGAAVTPRDPSENGGPGRYDANVSLIRRRLADDQRKPKPARWWWSK